MTYCVAMRLDQGIVALSDSRTNAGVDNINAFRKMHLFEKSGERVIVLMTAGNLSVSQSVINILREQCDSRNGPSLLRVKNMFEAARLVGEALNEVHRRDAYAFEKFDVPFSASIIIGGQIRGEGCRLFLVYAAGNFIEATQETPYFQIGESKYGKPILDRVLDSDTSLDEAAKCALVSMDSTMRSNLSVGLPLDLIVLERDAFQLRNQVRITGESSYFAQIREQWSEHLRQGFKALPDPDWQTI